MKHLEVRQKYSAARRIFNSLLGVSSGDETLRLMFDILLTGFDDYFRGSNVRIISNNIVLTVCYGEQKRYCSIKI